MLFEKSPYLYGTDEYRYNLALLYILGLLFFNVVFVFHFHVADLGTLQYLFPYVPMSIPNLDRLWQPSHLGRHLLCMGSRVISGDIREPFSRNTGFEINLHLKYSV